MRTNQITTSEGGQDAGGSHAIKQSRGERYAPKYAARRERPLALDHVALGAFDESDNLGTLSRRDPKVIEGSKDVAHECRPVSLGYSHAFVGCLHVAACVVHGASGDVTQKVDQELQLAAEAIFAAVCPEASQQRVGHQAGNQVF